MELELVIIRTIRNSIQTAMYVSANTYNTQVAESHPHPFSHMLPVTPSEADYLQVLSSVLQLLQNLSHEQLRM